MSLWLSAHIILIQKWRWLFHQLTVDTKKWFFRPPVMSFGFLDVIFWGEGTWDRYLQAPKLHLVISHTYGQHVLTKVAQSAKIDVFKQFWRQKLHKIKRKMSKNANNMFWMISNVYKHEDVSNLWCLFHFQSWKQKFRNISSFQLDFMLFLTSKLLKNVNFGPLDHCGQRVLTTCVWYDKINFRGL